MKKLIAVALSGLLLVSSVPVFADQPIDKVKVKTDMTTQTMIDQAEISQPEKVKGVGQGQSDRIDKGTKVGTPVLGARRDAMASYNLLKRDQANLFNEEDLVTLAVIADLSDLTIDALLERLSPADGATLTIDQLMIELELDVEVVDAEAAEIEAKLAAAEQEAVVDEPADEVTTEPTDETTTGGSDPEVTPDTEEGEDDELKANVARYSAILANEPNNRRIALKLARAYKELGQYSDAQAITDELLRMNAEDKLANIVAGQVMAAQGLYDGAIAKYRAALEVAVEPTTQIDLAEALDAAGETTEAAAVMEQAAEQTQDAATIKKAAKLQRKAGATDVLVYVNGKRPVMDVPPVVKEGRTLIPFRALAQAMNAQVHWDEETKTVTMERNGHVVILTLDSLVATIDGQPVPLDVPAQLHNNRTLVPVRLLAKALNADVVWDDETETVVVTPIPEETAPEEEMADEMAGEDEPIATEDTTDETEADEVSTEETEISDVQDDEVVTEDVEAADTEVIGD